jgi:hypothetical protein
MFSSDRGQLTAASVGRRKEGQEVGAAAGENGAEPVADEGLKPIAARVGWFAKQPSKPWIVLVNDCGVIGHFGDPFSRQGRTQPATSIFPNR